MRIPADGLNGDITLLIKGYAYASSGPNILPGTYEADLQISTQSAELPGAVQLPISGEDRVAGPVQNIGFHE